MACDYIPPVFFTPNGTKLAADRASLVVLDDQLHRCFAREVVLVAFAKGARFDLAPGRLATLKRYLVAKGVPARLISEEVLTGDLVTAGSSTFSLPTSNVIGVYILQGGASERAYYFALPGSRGGLFDQLVADRRP